MTTLTKSDLFKRFEHALRRSGTKFLRLSEDGEHPAAYQIIGNGSSVRARVYIWRLTPGGKNRPEDEWRIQPTGLRRVDSEIRFVPEADGKTLILGWNEDYDVFAAFDVRKHLEPLGKSSSIQVRENALTLARLNGIGPHVKDSEEVAFAIRPSYMGVYLEYMQHLHDCGSSKKALELLEKIIDDPQSVDDQDIKDQVAEPRQYAVFSARKALRDANFQERVLTAYSNACAMCGVQLRLVDAAHILPAALPESTDDTSNGVALCALHHRAYDRGLVTFDSRYRTHINKAMKQELMEACLDGGLGDFLNRVFPTLEVPPTRADRPAPVYVQKANSLRGWVL